MLPIEFNNRMKTLLGDEYEAFASALEGNAVRGVRINRLKVEPDVFAKGCHFPLKPLGYYDDGYILDSDEPIGTAPEHHAGIFYMQDPGAMASLSALDIPKGARVLDMCAAPGGKSGQAAAAIGDEGLLISNEIVPKRAKITVGNFERLGIRNAIVTSLDTSEFKRLYRAFFDVVIADVPCSGEGMFRKNDNAVEEWSEENVRLCAARQREILGNAAPLVRCGGHIIYSTCTYPTEENEEVIFDFLQNHKDYTLVPISEKLKSATSDGINSHGAEGETLKLCRRFYPHVSAGEGQFVALLKRTECDDKEAVLYRGRETKLSKSEKETVDDFLADTLAESISAVPYKVGENVVLISHGVPIPPNSVFSAGVLLGEIRKGVLTPHHQFFSAYGNMFKRKLELSESEDKCRRYLRGEEIENEDIPNGWCALLFCGAALGGGKAVGDRIKNHYPKGLRNM